MGNILIGINTEYSRSSDKPFEWAVEHAAGLKISALQCHGPLGRPEVHGESLKLAIRTAGGRRGQDRPGGRLADHTDHHARAVNPAADDATVS